METGQLSLSTIFFLTLVAITEWPRLKDTTVHFCL